MRVDIMRKFNLKKQAASKEFVITDKAIQENREDMNLCNKAQGVVDGNVNLSIPKKNKDNTVPFNVQLAAARKNETKFEITEAGMDDKTVSFGEKTKGVSGINELSEKLHAEKEEKFKKAEDTSKKDTAFWDKYVGLQLEEDTKNIKKNLPSSGSQLPNKPERFGKDVDKMVMASLKDADAMLFHIYAQASKNGRDLTEEEKQQVVDINSGKARILAQMVEPVRRSLEYPGDPVIKKDKDGVTRVYEADGKAIDEFKSCEEAKSNYPEGDMSNE
jgi:hypothetical protein